ncbi:VWA domain-containing protein [Thermus sp.]|uniref:VWA domain-containing protein n=1 Tax=Thermus sp. TaxID=275 RepID=UPI003D0C3E25
MNFVSLSFWALFLLFFVVPQATAQGCQPSAQAGATASAPLPDRFHYVFVLDTSGSMMGLGDGKGRVIFPKVKAELKGFIERLPQESRVTLQTFDAGPGPARTFALPKEKEALLRYIDGLEAKGSQTYLYTTLLKVLQEVERNRRPNEAVSIYVFTDGKDNDPAPLTMEDVARKYRVVRGPYDWLFYISLGIPAPKEVATALQSLPNARVLEAAPNQVPSLSEVLAKPSTLDLGNLWTSKEARRDVRLEARGTPQAVRLQVQAPALDQAGALLEVEPTQLPANGTSTLTFRLRNSESLSPGTYAAWLCLQAPANAVVRPQEIALKLAFHPPAEYALVPSKVPEALSLRPGERAELVYKLQGNPWAKEPINVAAEVPKGLKATLNGQEGPVSLRPGEELRLDLENTGLGAGVTARPTLRVSAPEGSALKPPPSLPPVSQPLTLWDWLWRLWWLWLPILLLLLWLFWGMWRRAQPWGEGMFTSAPDKGCKDSPRTKLKGVVDVGKLFGEERLEGVRLTFRNNHVYLESLPSTVQVVQNDLAVKKGKSLQWGKKISFLSPNKEELGTLTIWKS